MSQAAIEALLQQKIGLDPTVIGSNIIARALHHRLMDSRLSDLDIYLKRLQTSGEELDTLIETIIVPETWFFRDRGVFAFLSQFVKSEWRATPKNPVLRVLSVPCSTGEEPYSIAIALLESGLAPNNFWIDAVDISKKSIHHAQRGIYSRNSFRGDTLDFQNRYFTPIKDKYQLCESIRRTVNFRQGNLLNPQFLYEEAPYHVIFCRNLLIYLHSAAREKAIQTLDQLLTKNGLIVVGHSETGQLSPSKFASVRYPLAFTFRKLEVKQPLQRNQKRTSRKQSEGNTSKNRFNKNWTLKLGNLTQKSSSQEMTGTSLSSNVENNPLFQSNSNRPYSQQSAAFKATPSHPKTILESARILADRGQCKEATQLCKTYLIQNRTSAEAYVLLGQVHQAEGNEEQAEQCFNKAIYLEPDSYEALIHLALLKEHHGDQSSASILRQRIQRLQEPKAEE